MLSDALLQNLFGLFSGLVGAVIGGAFTLYATNKAIHAQNLKDDLQEEKEVQNLLDAIGVELGTLWTFHMARVGAMVETLGPGEALEFYYPLTQDYFTVYNSNADKIGEIKDADLRETIVVAYNKCKKVVDGFKYNNELYRDWRDYSDTSAALRDEVRLSGKRRALVEYGAVIRTDHFELKGYMEKLQKLLRGLKP